MKNETWRTRAFTVAALLIGSACASDPEQVGQAAITAEYLHPVMERLSSDEFEGRAPSSTGEQTTIAYLRNEFRMLGIQPGNGSEFFQEVPLVTMTVNGSPTLRISGRGQTNELAYREDHVVWTKRVAQQASLENSEMVFVGYGIVAPEYDWDDYEGLDVAGKTVVVLVNDPGFATQDSALFNGNTMTYYGRWTYKYEEAARQGAAGAIVVHETEPAGYGWGTVASSWTGPQFDLVRADSNMSRVAVEGWVTVAAARDIFTRADQDYDALKSRAQTRDFAAVPLGVNATVSFENTVRRSISNNVLGVLPGSDRADEYVVYMAHWDHFGRDPSLEGDQIYNGALDNASGTAGLLALARAFAALDEPPSRSVLFLAVTAEEFGLLGSAYYAQNPVYPRNQTVAAINLDGLNLHGPMNDITVIGRGMSELDDYLESAAQEQGRIVRSDPEPEKGFYYRSDHFSFAKEGIPALYTDAGIDHVEHGSSWTLEQREDYTANRYHKPSDEYDPDWDVSGAVDDLQLMFLVGYRIANSSDFPNWREGTEFKATRDAQMRGSGGQ
jgi:Zn-dependent M28 family amino/carboxypeptidase